MKSTITARSSRFVEQYRNQIGILMLSLLLNFMAYMPMLNRMHFSVDSYHLIENQNAFWYLQNGRYTWWKMTMWLERLGFNLVLNQRIFLALAMLAFTVALAMLTFVFARLGNITEFLWQCCLCLVLSVVWINVFVLEFLLFPESAISAALGSFFVVVAAVLGLRKQNVWTILGGIISLLIALGCYQSLVGYYLAFMLLGGCLLHRNTTEPGHIKRVVLHWCVTMGIAAFCSLFNVILVRYLIHIGYIADPGRGAKLSLGLIVSNVKAIVGYQPALLNNADGLLPHLSVGLLIVVLVILAVISIIRRHNLPYVQLLCAFVVSYAAAFAPHYIEKDILLTPRSNMAFWAVIATVAAVLVISLFDKSSVWNPALATEMPGSAASTSVISTKVVASVLVFATAFLAGSSVCMSDMAYDTFTSNVQDRAYASSIIARIKTYEHVSKHTVKYIAIEPDADVKVKYDSIRYQNHELNRRIMNTQYSNYQMINYLGGLNLQKIDMPKAVYQRYFAGKNWNMLNLDQQLVFSGDTAYLALY